MKKREKTRHNFWQSYSDMMAALLLIFMLIISISTAQMNDAKERAEKKEGEYQKMYDEYLQAIEDVKLLEQEIEKIVGVKESIIRDLKTAFDEKGMSITVDQTGSIMLDSKVFFDWESSSLKKEGKGKLKQAIPVYVDVLLSPEYIDYISAICIEGYCDSSGGYNVNVEYSTARAAAVADYCLTVVEEKLGSEARTELEEKLSVTGKSCSSLICVKGHVGCTEHKEDADASRRVEIKFELDDSETTEYIRAILSEAP